LILTTEEFKKRISVLERKAAREKKARNLAENQLEKYSLDIYNANQSLKTALASSKQKQLELEYLGRTSSDVASELPIDEMVTNVLKLTGIFCSASYGFYIISEDGKAVDSHLNNAWCLDQDLHKNKALKELANTILPLSESTILGSWIISNIDNEMLNDCELLSSAFYTNFSLSDNKIGWLIFFSKKESFEEEIFSVLTTSRKHLLSGIRRRLADVKILKRNVQLQDSLNKLKKARQQLIQSEKMASLGQLAAGVAHEINNPVAFISSNMAVLRDYLADYKRFNTELKASFKTNTALEVHLFDDICKNIDLDYIEEDSDDLLQSNIEGLTRVREIVDNLKCFSHSGDEVLVEMQINECIQSALSIAGNMFKYEHKIENNLPDNCPLILGNTGQLQQVFVNLFVNAAYAMENKGQLTISCSKKDEGLTVHVQDTGSGMDKETVAQLFTPFFTTKPVGTGTGLGLSVSYAILEAHSAQITVDSELNVGTTFNILFPTVN
jgi:signal transduction histidine kinase